jgi:hypothetical protein
MPSERRVERPGRASPLGRAKIRKNNLLIYATKKNTKFFKLLITYLHSKIII